MKKFKQDLLDYKIPLIILLIYSIFMELVFGGLCPFREILHIDCPGCGLTRATIALLKGNVMESLKLNYTCIFWLITIFIYFVDRYVKP